MIKIILSVVGLALAIFFHVDIKELAIEFHISFTTAKIIPYALEFLAICMIIYHSYSTYLHKLSYALSRIVVLIILVAGCGIAFAINPIYQGDFNNTHRKIWLTGKGAQSFKKGLTIVSLPGCPHCHARFAQMRWVSDIYPQLPIHVLVTHQDTNEVNQYKEWAKGHGNIDVHFFPKISHSIIISGFPNLYYKPSMKSDTMINWTNDEFGTGAWDYVINQFEENHDQ